MNADLQGVDTQKPHKCAKGAAITSTSGNASSGERPKSPITFARNTPVKAITNRQRNESHRRGSQRSCQRRLSQERHYRSGYCRSLLWKQNRDTDKAVEITQHKDADGDHQWQITFIHGLRTPLIRLIKRCNWTISTQSTTTAFTTWFISGGKPESKIPVFIP